MVFFCFYYVGKYFKMFVNFSEMNKLIYSDFCVYPCQFFFKVLSKYWKHFKLTQQLWSGELIKISSHICVLSENVHKLFIGAFRWASNLLWLLYRHLWILHWNENATFIQGPETNYQLSIALKNCGKEGSTSITIPFFITKITKN